MIERQQPPTQQQQPKRRRTTFRQQPAYTPPVPFLDPDGPSQPLPASKGPAQPLSSPPLRPRCSRQQPKEMLHPARRPAGAGAAAAPPADPLDARHQVLALLVSAHPRCGHRSPARHAASDSALMRQWLWSRWVVETGARFVVAVAARHPCQMSCGVTQVPVAVSGLGTPLPPGEEEEESEWPEMPLGSLVKVDTAGVEARWGGRAMRHWRHACCSSGTADTGGGGGGDGVVDKSQLLCNATDGEWWVSCDNGWHGDRVVRVTWWCQGDDGDGDGDGHGGGDEGCLQEAIREHWERPVVLCASVPFSTLCAQLLANEAPPAVYLDAILFRRRGEAVLLFSSTAAETRMTAITKVNLFYYSSHFMKNNSGDEILVFQGRDYVGAGDADVYQIDIPTGETVRRITTGQSCSKLSESLFCVLTLWTTAEIWDCNNLTSPLRTVASCGGCTAVILGCGGFMFTVNTVTMEVSVSDPTSGKLITRIKPESSSTTTNNNNHVQLSQRYFLGANVFRCCSE
ncbi:hypothetical protein Pelo_1846 [Pelomyxa schiedti]|nr:hypothetical protein Pelo_1846 [Pelomyxa schiedti]